ncbi:MAG: transcription-repair coupling factor [Phycisphaerales bacterium]|nr:transcription-repair coupling factor [Phycisphaerales bacterium]
MPERPSDRLDAIAAHPALRELARAMDAGRRVVADGIAGSSTPIVAGALARVLRRPVVLVVAHTDEAEDALDELESVGLDALRLPALEVLPGETNVSLDLFAERGAVVERARSIDPASPVVLVCPVQALMQGVPTPERLAAVWRTVRTGDRLRPADLARWLDDAGYTRADAADEPGQYALRGGILDAFSPGANAPVRLDFFGDEVERINEIDPATMASDRRIDAASLVAADPARVVPDDRSTLFLDLLPATAGGVLAETMEVVEQARGYWERATDTRGIFPPPEVLRALETRSRGFAEINQFSAGAASADARVSLPVAPLPHFDADAAAAVRELAAIDAARIVALCRNEGERQRLGELLDEFAPRDADRVERTIGYLHRGFIWGDGNTALAIVPVHELLHRFDVRRRAAPGRLRAGRAMDTFLDITPGDFVVHAEHGIARFVALTTMKPRALPGRAPAAHDEPQEYLTLEFAGRSKLHVPASSIDLVQRYVGGFRGKPQLSTIGGTRWQTQKARVAEGVRDLAAEMLRVRAAREAMPGIRYPPDTPWQKEFEAEFPYEETEDQLAALAEIKKDMASPRPMDRLLCGDVGFGKTELAVRAAFKAVESGRQAAVLVPTTVLAEQHERTFRARFAGYPFRVESLSRFKTGREQNEILRELKAGRVDAVIGTHRLLSADVAFADLGLVVVDEEQRFGVEHKEKLLRLRMTVDVLTLSATPIPRTLHMAMLGLRDISSLSTPPLDRRAIVTEVIPWNDRRIAQAIARELTRDGQVFFVHNRVHNIRRVADDVRRLAPDARVDIGHGQMPPRELEAVMLRFMRRETDVLVCTTIIESGIDIPTANTIIINDADRFGLADLHQLRGRVGRSDRRAYCYLLLPLTRTLNETARKRLQAVEQYAMLGAGFKIAMRDLEIRGAGNLLGPEQSGHIAAVGYEMYCRLLQHAVHELRNEKPPEPASGTAVEIGLAGAIPRAYIPSDARRLEAYRRIAVATTPNDLDAVAQALESAYGPLPPPARRLLDLAELRVLAADLGVRGIVVRERDVVFRARDPNPITERLRGAKGTVTPLPPKAHDSLHEIYYRPPEPYLEPETLLRVLRGRLAEGGNVQSRPRAEETHA